MNTGCEKDTRKKPKKFYSDYDKDYKNFCKSLDKYKKIIGWKSMQFVILKFQKEEVESVYKLKKAYK